MDFKKKRNIVFSIFLIVVFFVMVKISTPNRKVNEPIQVPKAATAQTSAPKVVRQGSNFVLPDNIGQVSTQNRTNYIENALHQNGKALKFLKMPIKVYSQESKYNNLVVKAFSEWQNSTGVLSFVYVNNPSDAQITVEYTTNPLSNFANDYFSTGNTEYKAIEKTGEMVSSRIVILTQHKDKELSEEVIYHTILHEIGHAIGINGHSDEAQDIMSTANSAPNPRLSRKDIETVRLIYSQNNFEQDSAMYKSARYNQIRQNLQRIPNDYNAWVQLGDFYFEGKYYDNAYKCFLYLTELNPDDPIGYSRLGAYFNEKGDFENAFKNFEIAHLKNPDNPIFIFDLAALCYNHKKKDKAKGYLANFISNNSNAKSDPEFVRLTKAYGL